jgi:[acyl-carrier-protein] S-malonyltransferase
MGRDFADRFPAAAQVFAEANDVLGYDLRRICFEGPADELTLTTHAQPAIFTCSVAAVTVLRDAGAVTGAGAAAGLSLGEYTALWFAGVFSFADGLRLVKRRGTAMQAAADSPKSGMVSLLGAGRALAEDVAAKAREGGVLVVANVNAPGQIVLSGDAEACARVPAIAKALGVRRAMPLAVAGAFHSPLMEPARAELERALRETPLSDPRLTVVSNVTAAPVTTAAEVRELLARQVVSPVLWEDSMRALRAMGITRFIEPAPGSVLSGLLKKILPDAESRSFARATDLEGAGAA